MACVLKKTRDPYLLLREQGRDVQLLCYCIAKLPEPGDVTPQLDYAHKSSVLGIGTEHSGVVFCLFHNVWASAGKTRQ